MIALYRKFKKWFTSTGAKWDNRSRIIPYPLRAAKISIDINIFGFWLKPEWHHRRDMREFLREEGETIWWFRWMWFQVRYSRWL